jgi:hypothetical protein
MTLLTSTRLAIGGLICTFLLRLVGTFVPSAFRIEQVAVGSTGLHLISSVAVMLFFVLFLRDYLDQSRKTLRQRAYLAIAGAALSPVLALRTLLVIVDPYSLPKVLRSPTIEVVLPVMGSTLMLVFFSELGRRLLPAERPTLKRPTTAATSGFGILLVLQMIVLLNYLATGSVRWFSSYSGLLAVGVLPLIAAAFLAILSFFISFHRHLTYA